MMLLRSQSISYFNVKRAIWLKVLPERQPNRVVRTKAVRLLYNFL